MSPVLFWVAIGLLVAFAGVVFVACTVADAKTFRESRQRGGWNL